MRSTHDQSNGNYLTEPRGLRSWLFTLDHKRIGVMYFWSTLAAFVLGGVFAMLLRLKLLSPGKRS